jgi:hypothetical protein
MPQYLLPPIPRTLPEQRWFQLLVDRIQGTTAGVLYYSNLSFSGSNLTSLATRNHNDLQSIQGGAPTDYQHLTTAQVGQVTHPAWTSLSFTGSNLTSITTRLHNDLQSIQGGAATDYQHLTTAQVAALAGLAGGLTTTITTAKLTSLGANGSMTFTNGVLTGAVAAT